MFSLVLDEDVDSDTAFVYPELYRELQKGRRLCTRCRCRRGPARVGGAGALLRRGLTGCGS